MRHPIGLFVAVLVTCMPLSVWAAPITVPTDLSPGDTYRLAFVTSTARDATSTDIADYNSFVAARHPTNSVGSSLGVYGQWAAELSPQWINLADADFVTPNSIYAISAELTVVPEPGTLVLVSIGAAALAGWMRRRQQE